MSLERTVCRRSVVISFLIRGLLFVALMQYCFRIIFVLNQKQRKRNQRKILYYSDASKYRQIHTNKMEPSVNVRVIQAIEHYCHVKFEEWSITINWRNWVSDYGHYICIYLTLYDWGSFDIIVRYCKFLEELTVNTLFCHRHFNLQLTN